LYALFVTHDQDPVPDDLCAYLCENDATFDFVLPDTGGEAISLGIEELMYYDASSGEKLCLIGNVEDFPETLIIAGLPFYNKYFIKHDYADGGQVCFAEKSKYPRLSTSSEICPLLLSPSDDDSSSAPNPTEAPTFGPTPNPTAAPTSKRSSKHGKKGKHGKKSSKKAKIGKKVGKKGKGA